MSDQIFAGKGPLQFDTKEVHGGYVKFDGEEFYKISHFDRMDPFFMSIVSASDHWMYIWSTGALSAGRRDPDGALFPYYTDDKMLDFTGITGSKTILFVTGSAGKYRWQPFDTASDGQYRLTRNLYKNIYGNKLVFEETNHDLNITFRYSWLSGEEFGFIRKSEIVNHNQTAAEIDILDGITNILPAAVLQSFQNGFSTLVDAYKKNELVADCRLGIYSLSSIPVDKAEPSESLRANTVWSVGLEAQAVLLSVRQLDRYMRGITPETELSTRAARGAYLLNSKFSLGGAEEKNWYIVAEVEQDSASVANLAARLRKQNGIAGQLEKDVAEGTASLFRTVASADGLQLSADRLITARHLSSVLFNIMRGGLPAESYYIERDDFIRFISSANQPLIKRFAGWLNALPEKLLFTRLQSEMAQTGEPLLEKLANEYLPFTFGRRHGDPSRPWNRFSIDIKDEYGKRKLNYQGNWRDIFQNWEALALSFPAYLESMISKFVNASTADGYNPYRVTRDGFDWEILDPADPWSYIGYWGDHQIIYLLKLLELSNKYHPGKLEALLSREIYAFSDVPYRIRCYDEIVADPHNTVDFDAEHETRIEQRVAAIGGDGKFVQLGDGTIYRVNLAEKILIPLLVKLTNFIPEGGIWLNTQRPEWNDANNALVGYGLSMVTLYYMRRHIKFCRELFQSAESEISVSNELSDLFQAVNLVMTEEQKCLTSGASDADRLRVSEKLGRAGSAYRERIYRDGFSSVQSCLGSSELNTFFTRLLQVIDHSIKANKRPDGLYHAYNLMERTADGIAVQHLYPMLEGQVAVLTAGVLDAEASLKLLDVLRNSALYRDDQQSYVLYPNRELTAFIGKNNIPEAEAGKISLFTLLADAGNHDIIRRDDAGGLHFSGHLRNAALLRNALNQLPEQWQQTARNESGAILALYEKMFDHRSFTGRSGTFFKYEGLGSIYWHMVSKLRLAALETCNRAIENKEPHSVVNRLVRHYREIMEGIGVTKKPQHYGAFPTDPYSYTPAHTGAQQPGMTGQVKEDVLSRFGELGVIVQDGKIQFSAALLRDEEFLQEEAVFEYIDQLGEWSKVIAEPHSLVFTLAQVPVLYHKAGSEEIRVQLAGTGEEVFSGLKINRELSDKLFARIGEIKRIDVYFRLK
jgi:hypothetical protein